MIGEDYNFKITTNMLNSESHSLYKDFIKTIIDYQTTYKRKYIKEIHNYNKFYTLLSITLYVFYYDLEFNKIIDYKKLEGTQIESIDINEIKKINRVDLNSYTVTFNRYYLYMIDTTEFNTFIEQMKPPLQKEIYQNLYDIINQMKEIKYPNMVGGKNKLISTHKKVNIMNKNKTIIERIIYIDNNKNKFIKLNKQYELLSNFKYNRKNKYYYIIV
jgi:hypothetical protein